MKYLKYIFALLVLAILFYLVDFSALITAFTHITPGLIALLLLISVLMIYVSCLKWNLFFQFTGKKENIFKLFSLYLMGYFVNLLLPSFVGGDVARSWYASEKGSRHNSFAATLMERLTGFIAMVLLAAVALFFMQEVKQELVLVVGFAVLALFLIVWILLSKKLLQLLSRISFLEKTVQKVSAVQEIIAGCMKDYKLILKSLGYSFIFYLVVILNTVAAAHAVGWYDAPVVELAVVLPLILLIAAIPIAPNGLGLQEGAFFYFLTMIGASPEEALGIGLVIRAKSYLLALFGSFVFLRQSR